MRLTFKHDRFELKCTYHERHIPREAGLRWDSYARTWWTQDIEVALSLKKYGDTEAQARLNGKAITGATPDAAPDVEVDVPVPDGLEYMPFQRAGIAFILHVWGDR